MAASNGADRPPDTDDRILHSHRRAIILILLKGQVSPRAETKHLMPEVENVEFRRPPSNLCTIIPSPIDSTMSDSYLSSLVRTLIDGLLYQFRNRHFAICLIVTSDWSMVYDMVMVGDPHFHGQIHGMGKYIIGMTTETKRSCNDTRCCGQPLPRAPTKEPTEEPSTTPTLLKETDTTTTPMPIPTPARYPSMDGGFQCAKSFQFVRNRSGHGRGRWLVTLVKLAVGARLSVPSGAWSLLSMDRSARR
jgi:hypothetical protein